MNQTPDSRQAVTERIMAKHRGNVLARARELEAEGKTLRYQARELQDRLKLYCGKVSSLIDEMRQADETTVKMPVLPPKGPAAT